MISEREVNCEGIEKLWWVTSDKGAFIGPLRDWVKGKDSFLRGITNRDVVIQAGGNCGMYARFYGRYFNQVYSFEPHPLNFECLQRNCQEEKYHLYNVALGHTNSKCEIQGTGKSGRNVGRFQVSESSNGDVDLITLDSLNLSQCNLIHLDIEGFEENALVGAMTTIVKFKPKIILEFGNGREVIESLGYKLVEKLDMDWIFEKE